MHLKVILLGIFFSISLGIAKAQPILRLDSIVERSDTMPAAFNQTVYHYDIEGKNIAWAKYIYRDGWDKPIKTDTCTYTYNNNGLPVEAVIAGFDTLSKAYIRKALISYSYNSEGKLTEELTIQYGFFNMPYYSSKRVISYNFDNTINTDAFFGFDNQSQIWVGAELQVYSYDGSSFLTEIKHYSWDTASRAWDYSNVSSWQHFNYKANNRLESVFFGSLDFLQSDPNGYYLKDYYLYDALGNIESKWSYDSSSGSWTLENFATYKYDKSQELTDIALPPIHEVKFEDNTVSALKEYEEYGIIRLPGNSFRWLEKRLTYHYSNLMLTQVPEQESTLKFVIYPNPSNHWVHVENQSNSGTLRLLSMSGKLLLEVEAKKGTNTIQTAQFPDGVYLVQLSTSTGTGYQPLVIR